MNEVEGAVSLGIDIGGTRLRVAAIDQDGRIVSRSSRTTPATDGEVLVATLVELLAELPALPVGIGIAGLVEPDGTVRYGPNIGVRDLPLARRLRDATGREVAVANDASVAALAEQRIGAGKGARDVILLTLGTGVGGGVVVDGRLVLGTGGYAGEVGHVIVEEQGRQCPCGNRGCIEAYASGTAIGLSAREHLVDPTIETVLRGRDSLEGTDVTAAAEGGDGFAAEVLQEVGHWLGVAIASLVNVLDPAVVLLGGGAAEHVAPWALPPARSAMARRLVGSAWRQPPELEVAGLGDDAGVVGAALLAADRAGVVVAPLDPTLADG